jgi:hypothetical protein
MVLASTVYNIHSKHCTNLKIENIFNWRFEMNRLPYKFKDNDGSNITRIAQNNPTILHVGITKNARIFQGVWNQHLEIKVETLQRQVGKA